jgi:hypothetical protein
MITIDLIKNLVMIGRRKLVKNMHNNGDTAAKTMA